MLEMIQINSHYCFLEICSFFFIIIQMIKIILHLNNLLSNWFKA